MNTQTTKDHIVKSADLLFYERGFSHTSFADIAKAVKISRGNFYHHFKTKDEILSAVIELRITRTKEMLEQWESESDTPKGRIRCYINILIANQALIKSYGCPVGTLSNEMAKLNHVSQEKVNEIFILFRSWLAKQFEMLDRVSDADTLAMHVLAWSQGTATMFNAFHDEGFLKSEIEEICDWLDLQTN